ncbi:MAG: alpha/beta hydrolase [Chitinophagales bacterium]|nr:alpha/beta hydrolase [Chitinophagales bacterium]
MNLKLKAVLWFLNNIQSFGKVDLSKINQKRKANIQASQLGRTLFDKKESVSYIKNTTFDDLKVRIYKNSQRSNQRVIVYFHGGGFVFYNIESHDYVTRRLCKMNDCTVISVEYRMAPEYTFPTAHNDAYRMVEYVYHHAEELGINKDDIFVSGDSAGGTLSANAAHHFKNNKDIKLKGQILIYPWVDGRVNSKSIGELAKGYMLTKEGILWFQKTYVPNEEDRLSPDASPTMYKDFSNLAPAFIATAGLDPLRDEGRVYSEKMIAAGNQVVYKNYKDLVHGFANIPEIGSNGLDLFKDIHEFMQSI